MRHKEASYGIGEWNLEFYLMVYPTFKLIIIPHNY